jgi:hypothetical protein
MGGPLHHNGCAAEAVVSLLEVLPRPLTWKSTHVCSAQQAFAPQLSQLRWGMPDGATAVPVTVCRPFLLLLTLSMHKLAYSIKAKAHCK